MEDFLPSLELTSSLLSKLWNLCIASDSKEGNKFGVIKGNVECSQAKTNLKYEECVYGNSEKVPREDLLESKVCIKWQKNPNSFQTASALQISKAEMQEMCDELKTSITKFKVVKINSEEEAEEISKYVSATATTPARSKKNNNAEDSAEENNSSGKKNRKLLEEKVLSPSIKDFFKIGYIIATEQITHKLLCKILAIVPDISISMYPIKGFAVVTTPMSIKLLHKDQPSGEPKRSKRPIFQTGFLTLDQERRIVPFHASDPQARVYSLVGIWVTGIPMIENTEKDLKTQLETEPNCNMDEHNDKKAKLKKIAEKQDNKAKMLKHPLVMASILRFLFSEDIKLRMSPRPKQKENENPCYLLLHFQGSLSLPQFLEFQLKSPEKGAINCWQLLESAYSIDREPKNAFKPIKTKLTCNKDKIEDPSTSSIYKLAYVISVLQENKVKKIVKKHIDKENEEPNTHKSRNISLKQVSNTCAKQNEAPQVKPCQSKTNQKVKDAKPIHIIQKRHVSEENTQIGRSGSITRNLIIKNGIGVDSKEGTLELDEFEEGVKGGMIYISKQKESLCKDNEPCINSLKDSGNIHAGLTRENTSQQIINPNYSLNSSINSTCLGSSKLINKIRPRMSGNSEHDQSSMMEQFPSYSANVSLVRTPDYSLITSMNGKDQQREQEIVIEQNKYIQTLQQKLMILQKQIIEMNKAQQSQLNNFLNISADSGTQSRCNLSKQQILNTNQTVTPIGIQAYETASLKPDNKIERPATKGPPLNLGSCKIVWNKEPPKIDNTKKTTKVIPTIIQAKGIIESKSTTDVVLRQNSRKKEVKACSPAKVEVPKILDPREKPPENLQSEQREARADSNDALSAIKETNESVYSIEEDAMRKKVREKSSVKSVTTNNNSL